MNDLILWPDKTKLWEIELSIFHRQLIIFEIHSVDILKNQQKLSINNKVGWWDHTKLPSNGSDPCQTCPQQQYKCQPGVIRDTPCLVLEKKVKQMKMELVKVTFFSYAIFNKSFNIDFLTNYNIENKIKYECFNKGIPSL